MRSTFKVLFYLKRNKDKDQKVVPVMGRITVNGSIAQFSAKLSVPETLWEVSGGRAKGRSLEADRINRHLDNIRTQIGKHYQDICDRESYVTAEKVKNAYLGFGEKYRLLLEAFEKFTGDLKKRVGIDRCHGTWNRYYKSIDHLRTFMRKEYNVSDMPLAELEQSFIEQYHVYLKSDLGLKPTTVSGYMASLTYDRIEQDAQGEWWISGNRQKTETKYVVKLLPYALFILNKYRGLTGDGRVFAMSTLDSIDDSLKNIARECGIDKQLSFHLARHTYATTICLSNGVSLETLSKMLGHKQITTTQIYAKVTPPMIDREVTMLREKLATKFSV